MTTVGICRRSSRRGTQPVLAIVPGIFVVVVAVSAVAAVVAGAVVAVVVLVAVEYQW